MPTVSVGKRAAVQMDCDMRGLALSVPCGPSDQGPWMMEVKPVSGSSEIRAARIFRLVCLDSPIATSCSTPLATIALPSGRDGSRHERAECTQQSHRLRLPGPPSTLSKDHRGRTLVFSFALPSSQTDRKGTAHEREMTNAFARFEEASPSKRTERSWSISEELRLRPSREVRAPLFGEPGAGRYLVLHGVQDVVVPLNR